MLLRVLVMVLALVALPARAAEEPPARGAQMMTLDPFILPWFDRERMRAHVFLTLRLDMASPEMRERITALLPRLRAEMRQEIAAALERAPIDAPGPDMGRLRQRLHGVLRRHLGEGAVRQVLVERLFIRRFAALPAAAA